MLNILTLSHLSTSLEFSENQYHNDSKICKTRQKKKFEKLLNKIENSIRCSLPDKWVINVSSRVLSTSEKSLLSKDWNISPASYKSNIPEIIVEMEGALNKCKVNSEMADDIRTKIVGVLNKPIRTNRNLSPMEEKALKALRLHRSIVILPANKG